MMNAIAMDRQAVYEDYERARQTFHRLLDSASDEDLATPTRGTIGPMSSCCGTCCSAT